MRGLSFVPSRLTLGTVQFGLPYGIANATGLPDETAVAALLDLARAGGVTTLDTARAYGVAEERIGRWLAQRAARDMHVITKVPPLTQATAAEKCAALRNSLAQSRQALGVQNLDAVLMHRASDLLDPAIADECERQSADGAIKAFGASVYDPDTAFRLLETSAAMLQIPISAADRRFERAGLLSAAAAQGVAVFGRSVFLQGALLMEPTALPPYLAGLSTPLQAVRAIADRAGLTLAELLILAARDKAGVISLVTGVDTPEQLATQLAAMDAPPLDANVLQTTEQALDGLPGAVLDPSRWPQ